MNSKNHFFLVLFLYLSSIVDIHQNSFGFAYHFVFSFFEVKTKEEMDFSFRLSILFSISFRKQNSLLDIEHE